MAREDWEFPALRQREPFARLVRDKLSFLFEEHGFVAVEGHAGYVKLESEALGARVGCDSRGELTVTIFRRGREGSEEEWEYMGHVGRASLPRLLEIAGERLRAEEGLLSADPTFFEQLGK